MSARLSDTVDVSTGILLMLAAGFFGWQTLDLDLGTTFRMGPGYFPAVLSAILFLLGLIILIKGIMGPASVGFGRVAWRGMLFILPAPVVFGLTVRGLGFVPALFITALIAAQASLRMRPLPSLILAVGVTIFSTLVFSYALGLPFQRFGPWVRF
ncbi:tripartite tricarboxylate transporter TctB family protein [Gemmobacter sp.]|uniref:tripartite tricarboxylate transporter TctB family protein n=1 Tax=Gemmobacter sp. TaxID=1898957 RepID=UPI002AFDFCDD|nr:tripartite tricarboxylate transporter TctB family protein [Gemmobacter sp.]